ncbi:hypothetical protein APUTEX25_001426 [Auxenochlorella protothecoides]|uniref:Uncharacterized protein n=1 Tax=Auxenochlorella protothecoides TaxID=3075 RepID=A0A3M7L2Z8_AUXPR|nr:hypothetical protein APUTEX25_001426 [Auxenochlorella protothecoides]|eukprot:RMZ56579.1 hypothetical protein APUTEX25_001426 [Auxenochlorella protothecoides]
MRMLLHEAEATATPLPTGLHGRLLELEYITQTEASRRRYRALSHLPLGATFRLCELDLSDCCSADTLDAFSEGLKLRAARRARLAKQAAHQSRRDTMAATEAAARAAYPVPQAAPPIEEWGGEPKLWIDPASGGKGKKTVVYTTQQRKY